MDVVTQAILQGQINTNETAIATNTQDISELMDYVTINPVEGVLTIPMSGKKSLHVKTTVTDGAAFEVVVTNPTVDCKIFWELTYTDGGAVTYTMSTGSTTAWGAGSAPSLTDGKRYRFAFFYPATNKWENFVSAGV